MAQINIYVCDRCGGQSKDYNLTLIQVGRDGKGFDLCPRCMEALRTFQKITDKSLQAELIESAADAIVENVEKLKGIDVEMVEGQLRKISKILQKE